MIERPTATWVRRLSETGKGERNGGSGSQIHEEKYTVELSLLDCFTAIVKLLLPLVREILEWNRGLEYPRLINLLAKRRESAKPLAHLLAGN